MAINLLEQGRTATSEKDTMAMTLKKNKPTAKKSRKAKKLSPQKELAKAQTLLQSFTLRGPLGR
jgi:hypothetical protein